MPIARVRKTMQVEPSPPYGWQTLWDDFRAALVVLLLAITFTFGIGVVSGMGVPAAFYCVVIVGLVAALLGGTRAMMSGTSVPLAVIVGTLVASGEFDALQIGFIVIMAGAIQIALGLTGIGRLLVYLPHVVLTGFMSGIGCYLLWSQSLRVIELGKADTAIAATCIAGMLIWPRSWGKYLPNALAGVAGAWAVSALWFPGAAVLGSLPTELPAPVIVMPSVEFLVAAAGPAILIAAISSAHTLMIALSADSMTGGRHNPDRQLAATGIANMLGGAFGAVPGSANLGTMVVLLRGGRTVVAGILVAVGTAGFLLGFGSFVATLPIAAVMAVILWTGWELVDWRLLKKVHRIERRYGAVFLLTVAIGAFGDPLAAVVLGFVAAAIGNAAALERQEIDSVVSVPLIDRSFLPGAADADPYAARVGLIAFRGSFTVASSRKLEKLMEEDIRGHRVVIFDLSGMTYVDDSGAHLLGLLLRKANAMGKETVMLAIPERIGGSLDAFDVLHGVPQDRIVDTMEDARNLAESLLEREIVRPRG